MAEEFEECFTSIKRAANLIDSHDIRLRFCQALMNEKKKDYQLALDTYNTCLSDCIGVGDESVHFENAIKSQAIDVSPEEIDLRRKRAEFMRELSGEVMLRIAVVRKEMGNLDQSMQMCNKISNENFNDSIRANALCLKVTTSYCTADVARVCCMKCELNFPLQKLYIVQHFRLWEVILQL